jgi:molybdopterin converting factor small subunit
MVPAESDAHADSDSGSVDKAVTLRYWAAARQAAGTGQERYGSATTLAELLDRARAAHPTGDLDGVLARCSFLVDGEPVGRRPHAQVSLAAGTVVEALPPFAGG